MAKIENPAKIGKIFVLLRRRIDNSGQMDGATRHIENKDRLGIAHSERAQEKNFEALDRR